MGFFKVFPFVFAFLSLVSAEINVYHQAVTVNSSELSIIKITPDLFEWEKTPGSYGEIEYNARLSHSPDLPNWLQYTYDGYNSIGYLYGVPPNIIESIQFDVIGWNKRNHYQIQQLQLHMDVIPNEPLNYVLQIKIDNMNVRDFCTVNRRRLNNLINIFSHDHFGWRRKDGRNVVPVFMESAVRLGENRVPLSPKDADGVVIHLASDQDFSPELKRLQVEVSQLWKLRPCPRDMKRTSVQVYFRRLNFLVDWCSFRLVDIAAEAEAENDESIISDSSSAETSISDSDEVSDISRRIQPEVFHFYGRDQIPEKSYTWDGIWAALIPGSVGLFIGAIIVGLFWEDSDYTDSGDEMSDQPIGDDVLFFEAAFRKLFSFLRINRDREEPAPQLIYDVSTNKYVYHRPDPMVYSDQNSVILLSQRHRSVEPQPRPPSSNNLGDDNSSTMGGSQYFMAGPPPPPPLYGTNRSNISRSHSPYSTETDAMDTHPNGAPVLLYAV